MKEKMIRLNGGFHNDVFYSEEDRKVVRISRQTRSEAAVLQELQWMKYLLGHGIAVPKFNEKLDCQDGRIITFFEYIAGNSIDVTDPSAWNSETFRQMGKILGRMHLLSKTFEIDEIHRPYWSQENPDVFEIRNDLLPWLRNVYDNLMKSLAAFKITRDTFGLIHNDFHLGNMIMKQDGSITIIDFDECAWNWYAQDIAVCFYHAYWQHESFNKNIHGFAQMFFRHFLNGYSSVNVLHPETVKQIPIFLKLREIFLFNLFSRKWDLNNLEDWQHYTFADLEKKIREGIPYGGITDFDCVIIE